MKAGFTISAAAHVLVLAGAMVSLASPTPLQAPDVEALPIDIIPFETLTKSVEGDQKAPKEDTPAPKQTVEPPKQSEAVNVGDTDNDTKAEAERKAPEPPVEKTEAPTPASRPEPKEPTPVPTPELAPKPEPKQDIALLLKKTEPQPETVQESEEALKLPEKVATPRERPTEQQLERAKTDKRKKEQEIAEAKAKAEADEKKKQDEAKLKAAEKKKADDAKKKAVVNKAEAAAGGAKRSKKKKSLGTKKGNNATKLAQSEIDALRGRLEGCWSAGILSGNPDAAKIRAQVKFKLSRDGAIDGRVKVKVTGGDRQTKAAFAISVKSAVNECAPYNNLPAEKYETWADVTVNFSLADML